MTTFALLLAFLGFCGLMARTAFSQGKKALDNYQLSIRSQFDEADHLLQEAKSLFEKAEQEKFLIHVQVEKIMNLAHTEVQCMMTKVQKEIAVQQETYFHLFNHQVETLNAQWQQSIMDKIWHSIYEYAEKVTANSSSQDVVAFIERGLTSVSPPKQTH